MRHSLLLLLLAFFHLIAGCSSDEADAPPANEPTVAVPATDTAVYVVFGH